MRTQREVICELRCEFANFGARSRETSRHKILQCSYSRFVNTHADPDALVWVAGAQAAAGCRLAILSTPAAELTLGRADEASAPTRCKAS
jgi:hypothetical protein